MSDVRDLIAKLEAAREGSGDLNRQIGRLVGWHRVEPRFRGNRKGGWIAPEDFIGTYSDGSPILDGLHGTTIHGDVSDFTGSVDAALSLVPEGWSWHVASSSYGGMARAEIWNPTPKDAEQPFQAVIEAKLKAPVPALALCIACLKARFPDAQ